MLIRVDPAVGQKQDYDHCMVALAMLAAGYDDPSVNYDIERDGDPGWVEFCWREPDGVMLRATVIDSMLAHRLDAWDWGLSPDMSPFEYDIPDGRASN